MSSENQTGRRRRKSSLSVDALEPDRKRALRVVMKLMAIRGASGREQGVAKYITDQLLAAGAKASAIRSDRAHLRTPLKGEVGNLVFKLPGRGETRFRAAPRRLLMAHMDTVPICVGSQPELRDRYVVSQDPRTGLGADNRAGCAVVLGTALELLRRSNHPPVTFLWTVQEEVGLFGARYLSHSLLGKPSLSFNFDGGSPEKLTIGATGGYRMTIKIDGIPSHAGGAPEHGASAIAIAAVAIADLVRGGWHGAIQKGRQRGTSNFGIITGGAATNVVPHELLIEAEARSHRPAFRKRIVHEMERAFHIAADCLPTALGKRGRVSFEGHLDYESFRLKRFEPCVLAAEEAVRALGGKPIRFVTDGGVDANWMSARGIPTVTLGCGQRFQHTADEELDVPAFEQACRIGLRLATDAESVL